MSTAASAAAPAASGSAPSVKFGHSILKGRLVAARRPQGKSQYWSNLLILPAPDAYTSPATVEILSTGRLGEKEEDISVKVRIGGYRRTYNQTDRETGEIKPIQTADNKLFAVED